MPSFKEEDLTVYFYGDVDAPAGAGKGAQEFKKILESLGPGEKFEDPYFPATSESFGQIKLEYEEDDPMNIKWMRPVEIAKAMFDSEPVFSGPFDEFAVNQGMVGDCWFLAVLADVATFPECVKTLIPEDNAAVGFDKGVFHFRFWCRGKWVDVAIDDRLPCVIDDDGTVDSAFTKPTKTGGFWAALMEKAYAKVYGNYGFIDAGYPADAMKDFTGGFIRSYDRADGDMDWKAIIKEGKSTNSIMSVGTVGDCPEDKIAPEPEDPDNPGPEGVSSEGIVLGHEYSLLDIQDVHDVKDHKKVTTLLKLRNPWGNATEWNGRFCDKDEIWNTVTPNLRSKPDERRADGEFWIPLESFQIYMDDLNICRWSAGFRGDAQDSDTGRIIKGVLAFQTTANFSPENTGPVSGPADFNGKSGYYVHLRSPPPDRSVIVRKDSFKHSCGLIVNLMYQNYIKSGDNPHIPSMGFYLLWSPGEHEPEGQYFEKVRMNERHMNPAGGARDVNISMHLEPGTAFIVPWIDELPEEETPFLLRIAGNGVLHTWTPKGTKEQAKENVKEETNAETKEEVKEETKEEVKEEDNDETKEEVKEE